MTLLNGEILWHLIWVLALCLLFYYIAERKRRRVLSLFPGKERSTDPAFVSVSHVVRFWRMILFLCVITLLFLAAARPAWGQRIMPYTSEGRDLLFVFDVSKSMLSEDVKPSRMEHAKYLVQQIVQNNPSDRFGLIAFAGNAFLECPLTIDKTSFLQTLKEFNTDTIPVGGTNVEKALSQALRAFQAAEGNSRGVILITDGDELTGDSSRNLASLARMKIPLFVMGVGDPSQPAIVQIREKDGSVRTLKDQKGNVVRVPLNEKKLSSLAASTGGIYVRSTTAYPGLDRIDARIKALTGRAVDSGKQTRPIERGIYPLLGAFVLFCLWLFLSEKRVKKIRKKTLSSGRSVKNKGETKGVLASLLLILAGSSFSLSGQEKSVLPQKTPASSVSKVSSSAEKDPVPEKEPKKTAPEEIYNKALFAHTQEKDQKKAASLYSLAVDQQNASEAVRSRSAQNLGVIAHQKMQSYFAASGKSLMSQDLSGAVKQIDQGLKEAPAVQGIYRSALRIADSPGGLVRNLTLLQQSVRKAQELKKKIQSLQEQHQSAIRDTRKALEQQKANSAAKASSPEKRRKDQQRLSEQIRQAAGTIDQLKKQAQDLQQKGLETQASTAAAEMEKARVSSRSRSKEKETLTHLQKALEALEQNKKDNKDNKDNKKNQQNQQNQQKNRNDQNGQDRKKDQDQNNKADNKQDRKDSPLPEKQDPDQKGSARKEEKERSIDKDQARSLLEAMSGEEKLLKDELKKRMKRSYGTEKVEKDW